MATTWSLGEGRVQLVGGFEVGRVAGDFEGHVFVVDLGGEGDLGVVLVFCFLRDLLWTLIGAVLEELHRVQQAEVALVRRVRHHDDRARLLEPRARVSLDFLQDGQVALVFLVGLLRAGGFEQVDAELEGLAGPQPAVLGLGGSLPLGDGFERRDVQREVGFFDELDNCAVAGGN